MTAVACLRIVVGEELLFADIDTMADLVAKVASSYLDTRWLWPRRYGLVAPFAFVLADPRVTLLDPRELQALAAELHSKLFGQESEGDVTLLTLEGDQSEVMNFAGATREEIRALLSGEIEGISSRVCKITRHEVVSVSPKGGSILGVPPYEQLEEVTGEPPARATYRGVYSVQHERFIGSALIWQEQGQHSFRSGELHPTEQAVTEHDAFGIAAAGEAVRSMPSGRLFLPISFSSLIKPSGRTALTQALQAMPPGMRMRLAATVYDTPRSPTFPAMTQARNVLDPFFANIDLCVTDPAFQIDYLAQDMARSVTLVLPAGPEKSRLAAMARFMSEAGAYQRKRILQGLADVRTRRELEACVRLGALFVTGPAVCEVLEEPIGHIPCPEMNLPLRNWQKAA